MTKQEELMSLAKSKGFQSSFGVLYPSQEFYYLWMHEVQKWLRDNYPIDMTVDLNEETGQYGAEITSCLFNDEEQVGNYTWFEKYEDALEDGLLAGVELVGREEEVINVQ